MKRFYCVMCLVLLVALAAPASADWGGITLDFNYSFGKAYVFAQSGDVWIPGPGATNAWVTVSSAPFVSGGDNKYFMMDINVNPGDTVWIDNIKVTDQGTAAQLLNDPSRLQRLGTTGRQYVCEQYEMEKILDCWERLLCEQAWQLHRVTGPWRGPTGPRYWAERVAWITGMGKPLRWGIDFMKYLQSRIG